MFFRIKEQTRKVFGDEFVSGLPTGFEGIWEVEILATLIPPQCFFRIKYQSHRFGAFPTRNPPERESCASSAKKKV